MVLETLAKHNSYSRWDVRMGKKNNKNCNIFGPIYPNDCTNYVSQMSPKPYPLAQFFFETAIVY